MFRPMMFSSGAIIVHENHRFPNEDVRDEYFDLNPNELTDELYIFIEGTETLQQYNAKTESFINIHPVVGMRGPKGEKGDPGTSTWGYIAGNLPDQHDLKNALDSKLNTNEKGSPSGVAELDSSGIILSSQLPSYVDSVKEYDTLDDFPVVGEPSKIYVAIDTRKIYRWGGTIYVQIDSSGVALGETSSTAYRGDRGKIAYDHSQSDHAPVDAQKNVQSDWEETDFNADSFIRNKPSVTASAWGNISGDIEDQADLMEEFDNLTDLINTLNNDLGWYIDLIALEAEHPMGLPGQYALIGTTDTVWTWDVDKWIDTGRKGKGVESLNPQTNYLLAWHDDSGRYAKSAGNNATVGDGLFIKVPHSSKINRYKLKTYGCPWTSSYAGIVDISGYLGYINGPDHYDPYLNRWYYSMAHTGIGFVANMIDTVNSVELGGGLLICNDRVALAVKPKGGYDIIEPLKISPDGTISFPLGISTASINIPAGKTYNINGAPHTHEQYLQTTGGTLTSDLNLSNNRITNLANPINGSDAVNLDYVSGIIEGVIHIDPVIDFLDDPSGISESGRYIVGQNPSGALEDHTNDIAVYDGSSWSFIIPDVGNATLMQSNAFTYIFNGSYWAQTSGAFAHAALTGLASDDHAQYIHVSTPRTISAKHTFTNVTPFAVTSNNKIDNLNASYLDGASKGDFANKIHTHAISDVTDIILTNPQDKDILIYDVNSGKFINVENSGGSGGEGTLTIDENHFFDDNNERDTYFGDHPDELIEGIYILSDSQFQQYRDEEWHDITAIVRGPPGKDGKDGRDGRDGLDGQPGALGADGAPGPQGIQGVSGIQGPPGAPGTNIIMKGKVATTNDLPSNPDEYDGYYCEDDGHCYVYIEDKWVDVGPIVGPQGPQGIQGPQGVKGDTGATGATGTQGERGFTGPKGDMGPRGPAGKGPESWQERVHGIFDEPPEVVEDQNRYIVSKTPNGPWTGHDDYIATWIVDEEEENNQWFFEEPKIGWTLFDLSRLILIYYTGESWEILEGGDYQLPIAGTNTLGGIQVGGGLEIDEHGVLSIQIASTDVLGGIKVGENLDIDNDGVLSAVASEYVLPIASTVELGGIKISDDFSIDNDGILSIDYLVASPATLGVIRIGDGLEIDDDGIVTVIGGGGGGDTVKVSVGDAAAGYLNEKLKSGTNITFTESIENGSEIITISSEPDNIVKVSKDDDTPGYLIDKLIAGAGIELTRNGGENETLTISAPIAVYSDAEDVATLPASPIFGQIFEYIGNGTAWEINANENQQIRILNNIGTKLSTTNTYACVMLVYLDDDNKTWLVKSSIGDISLGNGD